METVLISTRGSINIPLLFTWDLDPPGPTPFSSATRRALKRGFEGTREREEWRQMGLVLLSTSLTTLGDWHGTKRQRERLSRRRIAGVCVCVCRRWMLTTGPMFSCPTDGDSCQKTFVTSSGFQSFVFRGMQLMISKTKHSCERIRLTACLTVSTLTKYHRDVSLIGFLGQFPGIIQCTLTILSRYNISY